MCPHSGTSLNRRALTLAFAIVLVSVQASALPVCIGFAFADPDAPAMTAGCDEETCCTSLCYLDADGVHHCVHAPGQSCECGAFETDHGGKVLLLTIGILPPIDTVAPHFVTAELTRLAEAPVLASDLSIPTPPPR